MEKKTKPLNTSQPPDWVAAFRRQASIEGTTLSEWVGQACLDLLEKQNRQAYEALPKRTGPGRPRQETKNHG